MSAQQQSIQPFTPQDYEALTNEFERQPVIPPHRTPLLHPTGGLAELGGFPKVGCVLHWGDLSCVPPFLGTRWPCSSSRYMATRTL